ncbi:hypothetical protein [Cesiribacter andamanensis]|uniref:Putative transmembrane transcriptional regulator (Anti-sigma factor) n=1 Tax=Cesiribacter andamanensis AMV16 TaxID=1279009 RepID=M7N3G1_9BACT|nr:hypothetical protein [Cesiribacter andamanensis]EMR03223.1 putative transmembrane transcriptional regulator (anti-sigma factor) [Cesiribacter andamanensis AMV16]
MTTPTSDELYDAYYRQELSAADKAAFEARLQTDTDFAAGYAEFTRLTAGIQYYNRMRLVQAFKEADARQEPASPLTFRREEDTPKNVPLYRRGWMLAAAVVLLLAMAGALFLLADRSSAPDLYAAYYTPLAQLELAHPRGEDESAELKQQAAAAYQQADYPTSLQLLEKARQLAGADGELLFLQGLNLLALERYAEAEQALLQAREFRFRQQQDARWYLALAYLAQEKRPEARQTLETLQQNDGPYQTQSTELLRRLEQE